MKIHDCKQGSEKWLRLRMRIPTASEFGNLVTPEFKIRPWSTEMPNTYLAEKIAEAWSGELTSDAATYSMEQGSIREHQAIPWYEGMYDNPVTRVGFITTDDGKIGASPDGLIAPNRGIEVKNPEPKTHAKYLIKRTLPEKYGPQVHGCIMVADADGWVFLSWRHNYPKLVVPVERDDKKIAVLREAIDEFNARFEKAWALLLDMNGGPPPEPPVTDIADDGTITRTIPGFKGESL